MRDVGDPGTQPVCDRPTSPLGPQSLVIIKQKKSPPPLPLIPLCLEGAGEGMGFMVPPGREKKELENSGGIFVVVE